MFVTLAVMLLWMELSSDLAAELPVEILVRVVSVGYERQLLLLQRSSGTAQNTVVREVLTNNTQPLH